MRAAGVRQEELRYSLLGLLDPDEGEDALNGIDEFIAAALGYTIVYHERRSRGVPTNSTDRESLGRLHKAAGTLNSEIRNLSATAWAHLWWFLNTTETSLGDLQNQIAPDLLHATKKANVKFKSTHPKTESGRPADIPKIIFLISLAVDYAQILGRIPSSHPDCEFDQVVRLCFEAVGIETRSRRNMIQRAKKLAMEITDHQELVTNWNLEHDLQREYPTDLFEILATRSKV